MFLWNSKPQIKIALMDAAQCIINNPSFTGIHLSTWHNVLDLIPIYIIVCIFNIAQDLIDFEVVGHGILSKQVDPTWMDLFL